MVQECSRLVRKQGMNVAPPSWLQVYVEVSCERALGGGPQRPSKMGPAIAAAVVACVRTYLQHCTKAWDEVRAGAELLPCCCSAAVW